MSEGVRCCRRMNVGERDGCAPDGYVYCVDDVSLFPDCYRGGRPSVLLGLDRHPVEGSFRCLQPPGFFAACVDSNGVVDQWFERLCQVFCVSGKVNLTGVPEKVVVGQAELVSSSRDGGQHVRVGSLRYDNV